MSPIYLHPKEVVCKRRAELDCDFHYSSYINSLKKILSKNNSMKIRFEINRVKKWMKEYEEWAIKWHNDNYVIYSDVYVDPEQAYPSECVPPPRAPFIEIFSELKK